MKAASNNYVIKSLTTLAIMLLSNQVNAACNRDDISFYLDKGFTTDQITALCSEAPAPATVQTEPQESPAATPAMDDNALFLSRAIKGHDIKLSSDSLQYTQKKMCFEYGEEDLFGFTPKVCPDVIFTVSLKGLVVVDTGKKYGFYGIQEVRVKSSVKREIIGNLEEQKPEDRKLILEKFEKGDVTGIPVRDDFSLDRVKVVLEELAE